MVDYAWQPQVLVHYPLIEHVHLAPDGHSILFSIRTAYLTNEASEFRSQVLLALPAGGRPVPLTFGLGAGQPRWSSDGRFIAFLRAVGKDEGARPGLWAMCSDGGEAWPLTGDENGVRNPVTTFAWSPDGRRIAFVTAPWDEEKERRRQERDDVQRWREDYDYLHLHVVDFAAAGPALPAVTQLTHGARSINNLAWSPDGRRIAVVHQPAPLADLWPETRLATVAADGDAVEEIDLGQVAAKEPSLIEYSPDGRWIACRVGSAERSWASDERMAVFPVGGGEPRLLADVSDQQPILVGWSVDGQSVYVRNESGIQTQLIALPVDGDPGRLLFDGPQQITCAHANRAGQIAVVAQDFHEPTGIYLVDISTPGTLRRVAGPPLPEAWPQTPLPEVKLLSWTTADGFDVEGILYLPAGYDPAGGRKLPLLLHVHGGPAGLFQRQYVGHPYYYTPAALCERGIALLRCNPRGSGGYGKAFRHANRRDWGGGDYQDLQQGVDTVVDMGIADPARLGICGWSYGGFMTSWTITQTERFRAASIGAAVTNLVSFNGTADIPGFLPDYLQAEFWDDPEIYLARSPILQVKRVRTPAIIQHGGADPRVPLEQGLQFYNALRRQGVPVQMFIYPRQDHAISEPRLLADAARRNLEWFEEMLGQGC